MPRTYKKPPLIEALCELRFEGSQPWDWTIPGLVYERIRNQFPKKRQEAALEVSVQPGENQILQQMKAGIAKMQFLRDDESALIQIGPDFLAVNQLHPYQSWKAFKTIILENVRIYREIADPRTLIRIGLRYINRIDIARMKMQLGEYFQTMPQVPKSIPQDLESFLLQIEVPYNDPVGHLRLMFGTAPPATAENLTFMLDLDFYTLADKCPPIDMADEWIEAAHSRVEEAFDASFTEKTHKEVFEEELL
jgi:uncharacterized protein (TIGR04255 family)